MNNQEQVKKDEKGSCSTNMPKTGSCGSEAKKTEQAGSCSTDKKGGSGSCGG